MTPQKFRAPSRSNKKLNRLRRIIEFSTGPVRPEHKSRVREIILGKVYRKTLAENKLLRSIQALRRNPKNKVAFKQLPENVRHRIREMMSEKWAAFEHGKGLLLFAKTSLPKQKNLLDWIAIAENIGLKWIDLGEQSLFITFDRVRDPKAVYRFKRQSRELGKALRHSKDRLVQEMWKRASILWVDREGNLAGMPATAVINTLKNVIRDT